jgi:hypothetical protein
VEVADEIAVGGECDKVIEEERKRCNNASCEDIVVCVVGEVVA